MCARAVWVGIRGDFYGDFMFGIDRVERSRSGLVAWIYVASIFSGAICLATSVGYPSAQTTGHPRLETI